MSPRAAFMLSGLGIALLTAVLLSPFAATAPDGLERVSEDLAIDAGDATPPFTAPLSDYATPGLGESGLSTAIAGLVGTLATFFAAWGIGRLLRRRETGGK